MKFTMTMKQALENDVWKEICEIKGIDPRRINEGSADETEEISLSFFEFASLHCSIKDKFKIMGIEQ